MAVLKKILMAEVAMNSDAFIIGKHLFFFFFWICGALVFEDLVKQMTYLMMFMTTLWDLLLLYN